MTSPEDDGALMGHLRRGDDRALDALMQRWQVPLRRFIYRWTQSEADALDLAQETFVRVYRNRDRFRPETKFSTWLFSIALNLCRDRARRLKTRPTVAWESAIEHDPAVEAAFDSAESAALDLARKETAQCVRRAVGALPEPLREAVLLCEFEGLSQAEAAKTAGCSVKAVETRLYRARAQLRTLLAKYL